MPCNNKNEYKKIKADIELLIKLLSKRYILAPLLFALLYLLEHPNANITHALHAFLRSLLII